VSDETQRWVAIDPNDTACVMLHGFVLLRAQHEREARWIAGQLSDEFERVHDSRMGEIGRLRAALRRIQAACDLDEDDAYALGVIECIAEETIGPALTPPKEPTDV
jgi:hypothetical protein